MNQKDSSPARSLYTAFHKQYPLIYFPAFVRTAHEAMPSAAEPPAPPARPRPLRASQRWITVPSFGAVGLVFFNILLGYPFFAPIASFVLLLAVPPFAYFGLYRYMQQALAEQHIEEIQRHKAALADYEIMRQRFKAQKDAPITEAAIQSHRHQLIIKRLKTQSAAPKRLRRMTARGRSEERFYDYLVRHFGRAFIRKSMQLGDFELPYAPDFCWIDESAGLHIDIEIDEPYVANTLEAIHYKGADTDRNDYFTQQGWLVIRFSEEQIVKYPEACCEQIEALRQFVLYLRTDLPVLVPVAPHWSRKEAEEMAKKGSRNYFKG